jgi:phosphoribosylanthranilate isomerase
MRVKVCGITNVEDALKAAYAGATAVGFVFHKKSPRYVSPSKARNIIDALPPFVTPVGVFVDLKEGAVKDICRFTNIQTLQLHGNEFPDYCKRFRGFKLIKAFRIHDLFDFELVKAYKVDAYLFDTYQEGQEGGTGKAFNWNLLKDKKFSKPYILSGGLTVENVVQAIASISPAPFAVDVSSGVEKLPGIKDPRLVKAFLEAAQFQGPVS